MRTRKTILLGIAGLLALGAVGCYSQETTAALVERPKVIHFEPATYNGETGTISLPVAGQSMFFFRKIENDKPGDYLQVSSQEKDVKVPVGTYTVMYGMFTVPGKNDTKWTLNMNVRDESDAKKITVESGKSIEIAGIAEAAKSLNAAKTGTVIMPVVGDASLTLVGSPSSKIGYMMGSSKSGKFAVPVGKYMIASYGCTLADKTGGKWSLNINPSAAERSKQTEIKPNQTIKMEPVKSIDASIDVNQNGKQISLSLKMLSNGRSCSIMSADGKGEAPGFQVLSKSGDVLMSGKFQYG